jgi:glycosyltransferase involved in cell wall biosynthesis
MATPAERPLVSIVTPSLNQARWLREAIESVRAQTYEAVEHVVVDGGSTDGTLELLREYADAVRFVSEPDRGQSHALNKGFSLAQGTILGWLNADDAYEPAAVAEGVAALEASGAGLVYADVVRVNDDRVNPRRIRSRPHWNLWAEVNEGCGIYSPAVFFTREALGAVGGADEALHYVMDYDLWLRIGKRFPVVHVDAVWALQRQHDAAKSIADKERFWPERLTVSRRHGGRLVSPLAIRRYVRRGPARRLLTRAASHAYALAGRRAKVEAEWLASSR